MLKKIKGKMNNSSGLNIKKSPSFIERFDKTMEAITFAEAGEPSEALRLFDEYASEPKKVLLIEKDRFFSSPVINYAVGFAERMGYEIVALNIIGYDNLFKSLPDEKIIKEFKKRFGEQITLFSKICKDRGISFHHLVKIGDFQNCIKEVKREIKRIEFVIYESEALPEMGKLQGLIPQIAVSHT